jgi:hypothetical protein
MTDHKPMSMLREANPVSSEELEQTLSADDRSTARGRAIRMAEQGDYEEADRRPKRGIIRRGSGPRALVRPVAVVLCVGLAAALVLIGLGNGGGGSTPGGGPHPPLAQPPFADAAIRWAKVSPRLLVTESGWYVQTISENGDGTGEIDWTDGGHGPEGLHYLEISWFPSREYNNLVKDRSEGGQYPPTDTTVLGKQAKTFHEGPTADYDTFVPPDGDVVVEVRGDVGSEDGYFHLLQTIEPTSVNGWLSAMPASVLETADRSTAVDSMVNDIPLPPGMNESELQGLVAQRLKGQNLVSRYNLGAAVTSVVSCNWLDSWVAAKESGDQAAAQRAVDAMATAPHWTILDQMKSEGDWPSAITEYGDAIRTGTHLGPSGEEDVFQHPQAFQHAYNPALGCNE